MTAQLDLQALAAAFTKAHQDAAASDAEVTFHIDEPNDCFVVRGSRGNHGHSHVMGASEVLANPFLVANVVPQLERYLPKRD